MDYKTEAAEYQARKRRIAEARSVRRRKRRNEKKLARESRIYEQQHASYAGRNTTMEMFQAMQQR